MTDEQNARTKPDEIGPSAPPPIPPDRDDDLTTVYAPSEEPVPTANVLPPGIANETGTIGDGASSRRRSNGLRWAIALGGVAVVLGVTVALLALAGGRPSPSIAVGYMPTDTVSYGEYRLDLPGDQRGKMAAFLAKFPGFADQANVQAKLYEVFDRIVAAVSDNKQTYTANIDPWFAGQIAMGSGPLAQAESLGPVALNAAVPLVIISVKDQAKATDWLRSTLAGSLSETQRDGATFFRVGDEPALGVSIVVTDKVLILGSDTAVQAAFDSKGEGKLAQDAEFKAAFGTVTRDYVSFSYTEYRAMLQSLVGSFPVPGLAETTVDEEILAMVPAWQASSFRFEDDALVGDTAYPSIDIGYEANNKKSSLLGQAPAGTIFYAEAHDVGPSLKALLDRFRKLPELKDGFAQFDTAIGVVGGFDGLVGWWGDAALAVSKTADGSIGGALLIKPTDPVAAKRTFDTVRSLVALAGGGSGIKLRDVDHAGTTITVIDLSAVAASGVTEPLPPGVKAELAYAVTNDVVVFGYGESFVASVLDAGPGPSLADDARVTDVLERTGEENIGLSFVDLTAIRELVEPLAKEAAPADEWAFYEREIRPYLLPIDALASGARTEGDLDRLNQVFTVK